VNYSKRKVSEVMKQFIVYLGCDDVTSAPFENAVKEASIGRVRPKIMTASTAILGLLPLLVVRLHGTEIERPLAIVMVGGLLTSLLFTLLALPTFYIFVHRVKRHLRAEGSTTGV
jgi:heavy metal efflux system protein